MYSTVSRKQSESIDNKGYCVQSGSSDSDNVMHADSSIGLTWDCQCEKIVQIVYIYNSFQCY